MTDDARSLNEKLDAAKRYADEQNAKWARGEYPVEAYTAVEQASANLTTPGGYRKHAEAEVVRLVREASDSGTRLDAARIARRADEHIDFVRHPARHLVRHAPEPPVFKMPLSPEIEPFDLEALAQRIHRAVQPTGWRRWLNPSSLGGFVVGAATVAGTLRLFDLI